jgi:hypothetical protein
LGSAAREIESAIDSDPGNALLWHASADTNARHFSTAANRDRVNDRCGSFASVERYPWHVCFTLDSGHIAHCREPDVIANKRLMHRNK